MRAVLLSLVISMMLIGCSSVPLQGRPTINTEEYEVYRVIIEPVIDPTEVIVIMNRTRTCYSTQELEESFARMKENIIGIEDETINDYIDANARSHLLRDDLDLGFTYILISEEERDELMVSREMLFGPPYNRGIITFSRVGFNRERDQALVYVGYYPFGHGGYVFLTKENGVWRIQQERMIWIS